jgi:hypothetical protein
VFIAGVGKRTGNVPGDGRRRGARRSHTRAMHTPPERRLFAPLPTTGIWTRLGLGRGAFFAILTVSTLLFLLVPAPLWSHLREGHFTRLTVSYAIIPVAVSVVLARHGRFAPGLALRGALVIALLKLVLTTGAMMAIALVR